MKPYRIRLEYGKTCPDEICIVESAAPMISWAVASSGTERQQAYRITVMSAQSDLWDTGWIESAAQSVPYAGLPLAPGVPCTLCLSLRDGTGTASPAVTQRFCLGTLPTWDADWISDPSAREDAALSFLRDFDCASAPVSACLFVCGLGYHKVSVNGQAVFAKPMNPAHSQYDKRCYYTVLPGLEAALHTGRNRLGIRVASGWRSALNPCYTHARGGPAAFAGPTQLSASLRLQYADGSIAWLHTDGRWQCFDGPTVHANLFLGETFDAARHIPDWSQPAQAVPGLRSVSVLPAPGGIMRPQTLEPVDAQEEYAPVSIDTIADGVFIVDFGQNIAGVCRLRVPDGMRPGGVIELRHAEVLDEEGGLYLAPLRRVADHADRYIAAGGGRDPLLWQPEFTYHGFRYAQVSGYPHQLLPADIRAVSLYTDVAAGSSFRCGNPLVNQIQQNLVRTEKANIHSILTDCPQRDERMGWFNDATVRFEETPYNFDVGRLFPKVVRDLMDVQGEDGAITCTAPHVFGRRPADPVCSSYLIAGWQAYLHTGNLDILREGYPGFAAWNTLLEQNTEGHIVQYSYYGDWASPAYACENEQSPRSAVTPGLLMSTGYYYYNARLLAKMARALGNADEARMQDEKADAIAGAFLGEWWDESTGKVGSGSQACQAFALWLDILPEAGRARAADWLHRDLMENGMRITTGNLCTRYLMDALTRFGYLEDAWQLITREEYPSFGHMIQHEATTIWERFELKKDPGMNSHCHPMYGAVGYWFYAYLAGIIPTGPGYETFTVRPYIPGRLLSANAVVETPRGDAHVRWIKRYGALHLYVGVPHGAQALVHLPWGGEEAVGQGFHHWQHAL